MRGRPFWILIAAFIVGLGTLNGEDVRSERHAVSDHNRDIFLRYLGPTLKLTGGVARLYYRADCWTQHGDGILFPSLHLHIPVQSRTGLQAIQDIFREESAVTVTQGQSAIKRILIGSVSYDLLNTKIHVLRLGPSEQYNPEQAISAIQRTNEIRAKMNESKFRPSPTILFGSVLEPATGLPHLPAVMKDVTMDEALDRLAQTFSGLVSYGECNSANGTRLFSIEFEYIR